MILQGAPDGLLRRIASALAAVAADPAMAAIAALVEDEAADRRLRDRVLAPLLPLADAALPPPRRALTSPRELAAAWRRFAACAPDAMRSVRKAFSEGGDDASPYAYDALCQAVTLPARTPQEHRLATLVALVPALRAVAPTLAARLRALTPEAATVLRLAYKDATEIAPDAGTLFVQALFAGLDEPWRILILISAIADRPSDRYLAASEFAPIGAALLDDVEARLVALRTFDPAGGMGAGSRAASSAAAMAATLSTFDEWLTLHRDGPWGERVAAYRRELALTAEALMRAAEPALALALPTQPVRSSGGRVVRSTPKLSHDLDGVAVARAEALLAFVCETRGCAPVCGFGALRAATVEALARRLALYAEDLVTALHETEDADMRERLRAHLECAADFTGFVAEWTAVQTLRRRAAAA